MPIIGTLPATLTNGTLADATQVMADFNFIVSQVNANAAAGGTAFTSIFLLGTSTAAGATATATKLLFSFGSAINDQFSEVSYAASTFTAANTGKYVFTAVAEIDSDAATTGISGVRQTLQFFVNNVVVSTPARITWPFADSLAREMPLIGVFGRALSAGDVVDVRIVPAYTATAPNLLLNTLTIQRIA